VLVHASGIHLTVIGSENRAGIAEALIIDFTGNLLVSQKCLSLDLPHEWRKALHLVEFVQIGLEHFYKHSDKGIPPASIVTKVLAQLYDKLMHFDNRSGV
jgi:hypothetical protein